MRRNPRKAISTVVIAALCLWLAQALSTVPVSAFPVRGGESWSDTFDSTEGIGEFNHTKVASDTLRVAEADLQDLGVAVPGESVVHAVLGTTLGEHGHNVYCGTGERGHLVEHDPDEVYQEGYQGPTHWGVSNSRGQPEEPSGGSINVRALATDGVQYVFLGTDPDGELFSFEPYNGAGDPVQRECQNLGTAPGGILTLTYDSGVVYGGTSSGEVFSYAAPGPIVNLGQPSGSNSINDLVVSGTDLYIGCADGHLYGYDIAVPAGFNDLGNPSGTSEVNALAVSGTDLFMGLENGHVYVYTGIFNDQGVPANSGGAAISALSLGTDGNVYGGTANGRLFSQSGFEDHDPTSILPGNPITGITQVDRTIYLSNDAGYLYSYTGPGEITELCQPDNAINDIDSVSGLIYMGMESGKLWSYNYGTVTNEGEPDPGDIDPIKVVLVQGSKVYLGLGDGRVFSYSYSGSSFEEIADVPGTVAVTDLLWVDGVLFVSAADGNLYSLCMSRLNGVFTLDASNTWMVGNDGNIIYQGSNRSVQDSGTDENLNGAFAVDASHAWAVGNQGAVSFYDGSGWSVQGSGATGENLTGVCAVNATEAWAVGWEGAIIHTSNGGADWAPQTSGTNSRLMGVAAADAGYVWAVGAGGTIRFYNGSSWVEQESGTTTYMRSVCAVDTTHAWAVGDDGTVLKCEGASWSAQTSGTAENLMGVCAVSATEAWAVGDGGTIIHTVNGTDWTTQTSGTTEDLRGVSVANATHLWAAGENGTILHYDGSWSDEGFYDHGSPDGSALNALTEYETVVYLGMEGNELYSFDGAFSSVGDCGSHIKSLAPGDQGVLAGTDDGHLWIHDGVLRDGGLVPDSGSVRTLHRIEESVFGGTATGGFFSHEDAFLADKGQQVKKQVMAYCMTHDPGEGLIYAGTYRNAHFLIIDPATDRVWDRGRPVNGEREIEDIVVMTDGTVYGGTYAGTKDLYNPNGGRLFTLDPVTGCFTDLGEPPAPDDNWWVSALCEGPAAGGPLLYVATSNSDPATVEGYLFSYDASGPTWTPLGVPYSDEGTRSLVLNGDDGRVYGGTWKVIDPTVGHLYSYDEGSGIHQLGEPPVPAADRNFMGVVSLAYRYDAGAGHGVIYGGEDNGYAFSYEAKAVDPGFGFTEKVLEDANAVPTVVTGPNHTIWYGTEALGAGNGHVVNYDPALSQFRDVCETGFDPPYTEQHKVASLAFATSGALYGGTMGSWVTEELDNGACHLFKIDPYKTGAGPYGLSSCITPGLSDIGGPVPGQDAVGALCAPPGDVKILYGGTSNDDDTDAHLFMYNHIEGTVVDFGVALPDHDRVAALRVGADGYVYGGTANNDGREGRLFRFYPVFDPVQLNVQDLGTPLSGARGIFSLAAAGNGKVIIGTGDKGTGPPWDGCHLVEYDPSGVFDDKGVCSSTQGRLAALATGADGLVYGGTGASPGQISSAHFIKFDPSTGDLYDSVEPEFGSEYSIHSVAIGQDGKVYYGTGPDGRLVSYDIAGGTFCHESAGWPYAGEAAVLSLTATGDAVFGCAGNVGRLFSFTTPGSVFTDMGPPAFGNTGVPAATTDNLGKPCFGTAGDPGGAPAVEATLVRYDPVSRFEWDRVTYSEDETGGTVAIDVVDESEGDLGYNDVSNDADISGIDATGTPTIRLKGNLTAADELHTPWINNWEVTWRDLPGIDELYPSQTYRGDSLFIWGSNFGDTPGTVTVGGAGATPGIWYENLIQVQVPAGAANGDVTVEVGGDVSNTGTFSLLEIPSVASVSPSKAHVGDIVKVSGSWFLDERGASYVSFNGVAGTDYQSWSDGLISVRVPGNASTGDLTVNVNGHPSNAVGFTVLPGGGPVVKITEPAEGSAVAGQLTVRATAQSDENVDRMEFLVDDNLIGTDKTAPYECQWDTDAEVDGAHRITARACDEVGREGADEITAYVDHTVPRPSDHWYFAEGCTDYGFETWVLIQNPASEATVAHVTFMDDTGETTICAYDLPADSRTTVNAAAEVPDANISVEVRAGHDVICERSMYWNGRVEGHGSIGTTSLSGDWYFAEGCTDYGFETYVLVGNPGEEPVEATLRYMFDDGGVHTTKHELQPHSRLTVDAHEEVGAGEFSVHVGSGEPGVVAERAMYYGGRNCGTGTIGCKAPSNTWYLSEGSTDWGFETWLLIQNPGDDEARVTATYRESGGEMVEKVYIVGGNTRYTVNLQTAVGIADVSTQVSSDVPVVCERAMYWNNRSAGHCTVGSPGPGTTWYLAEGCTDYGFETWLLIDNPGEESQTATVTFMTQDGSVVPVQVELPPQCRISLDAAQHVPASSFSVSITTPEPVMAERAMYWNGRQGGTGSIGAR